MGVSGSDPARQAQREQLAARLQNCTTSASVKPGTKIRLSSFPDMVSA
jgi:hypothetical protein